MRGEVRGRCETVPVNRRTASEVIVIGAGVIGCSIAYHLARRGVVVTVLERGDVASGTSSACDGMVLLQSKKPGVHLELALASVGRLHSLVRELPVPIEYRPCGGLVIMETARDRDLMEAYARRQRRTGLAVELVDGSRLRRLEPALSRHLPGAAWCREDGLVNPMALTLGLAHGARSLGARFFSSTAVLGIETRAGRAARVHTTRGSFCAELVINAAGVSAPAIAEMLGLRLPIRPRRGQLIVTEVSRPLLSRCLISARYLAAKFDPETGAGGDEGSSMEQTGKGNFLLGSTREFVGFDRSTTLAALRRISAGACRILPALSGLRAIRSFAGLRPYTPDGLPLVGPVERVPGLFVAAGHEGDGIALAAITGKLVAQWVSTGRTEIPLDAFSPDRFPDLERGVEEEHGLS